MLYLYSFNIFLMSDKNLSILRETHINLIYLPCNFFEWVSQENLFHLYWCAGAVSGYSFFGNGAISNCHSDVVIWSRHSNSIIRVTWHNGKGCKKGSLKEPIETPGSESVRLFEGEDRTNFHVLIIIPSIIEASKCQMYWEWAYIYVSLLSALESI